MEMRERSFLRTMRNKGIELLVYKNKKTIVSVLKRIEEKVGEAAKVGEETEIDEWNDLLSAYGLGNVESVAGIVHDFVSKIKEEKLGVGELDMVGNIIKSLPTLKESLAKRGVKI